jgi:hypothetical protein
MEAAMVERNKARHVQRDHPSVQNEQEQRDKGMDKTLEDSYPASDPPSTIPDPDLDENAA